MGRDWVIWFGCVLIFCSGVVWGMIPDKQSFMTVANIHDLFDIFGAIATMVAVVFAIGAWRRQINGQADLELARRLAVDALRVKEETLQAWVDAKFAVNQCPFGLSSLPRELLSQLSQSMDQRVKKRDVLKLDFYAALQEARAIWGKEFSSKYDDLNELFLICNRCAQSFVSWADPSTHINSTQKYARQIIDAGRYLDERKLLNIEGRVEEEINRLTRLADLALEKKMLRE